MILQKYPNMHASKYAKICFTEVLKLYIYSQDRTVSGWVSGISVRFC